LGPSAERQRCQKILGNGEGTGEAWEAGYFQVDILPKYAQDSG
jgi:hypothetical protein